MTTTIIGPSVTEVIDTALLGRHLVDGYIRAQVHPTEPYTILNYTEKTAYEGAWDDVTSRCRGLIIDQRTGEVLGRPWPKFFNYGQTGAPDLDLNTPVCVTDKADGSLGVLYPTRDGWAIATRGSFTSDQAIHATAVLRHRYADYTPPAGFTVLVEIVYPANRIVLDYGDLDDLILLGAVNLFTGRSRPPNDVVLANWPGPRTTVFDYPTLAAALEAAPRENAEGLVVQVLSTDGRVKIKQEDYILLHKIVTGLNARTVWQAIVDGKNIDDLITPLPDEFHDWVRTTWNAIVYRVGIEAERLMEVYKGVALRMRRGWDPASRTGRAEFAAIAATHPDRWALFALLDGRDIVGKLLIDAKPEAFVTPSGRSFDEDNA